MVSLVLHGGEDLPTSKYLPQPKVKLVDRKKIINI